MSPLTRFRKKPEGATRVSADDSSKASASAINPMEFVCRFDLHGRCNDADCPYQHLSGNPRPKASSDRPTLGAQDARTSRGSSVPGVSVAKELGAAWEESATSLPSAGFERVPMTLAGLVKLISEKTKEERYFLPTQMTDFDTVESCFADVNTCLTMAIHVCGLRSSDSSED